MNQKRIEALTEAINTCYKRIFYSNTKFSDLSVIGFNNSDIIQQLLDDIIFCLYIFSLRKLNIFMLEMGKSKDPEWNYAGEGYKSVFQYNFNDIRSIFVQELEDEECIV